MQLVGVSRPSADDRPTDAPRDHAALPELVGGVTAENTRPPLQPLNPKLTRISLNRRHVYVLDERLQPMSMLHLVGLFGGAQVECKPVDLQLRSTQRCVFGAVV